MNLKHNKRKPMEDTLTTENTDSQVEVSNEQVTEETSQVEQSTTDTSYDDAWNKLDLDDESSVDELLTPAETSEDTTEEVKEQTEEEIATEAFMKAAPVLKFKGKDIPIDNPEEIIALAQKGFKLETEMSKIKPQKKVLNTVEDVPLEVLQAVADLQAGKQDALEYLKDHYGLKDNTESDDYFGINNDEPKGESTYKPEVKVDNPIEDFWNEYSKDNQEVAGKVSDTYKDLDPTFQSELYKPGIFQAFVASIETGEFDDVYPLAVKERVLNPALGWIDAYSAAAQKVGQKPAERNDPQPSAQIPSTKAPRAASQQSSADAIWEDDDAFLRMQDEIFNQG